MTDATLKGAVEYLTRTYSELSIPIPRFHTVLGSGYAAGLDAIGELPGWSFKGELPFHKIPGLIATTAPGHRGHFRFYLHRETGEAVTIQVGRLHGFEGLSPRKVILPILLPRMAGTEFFALTNAAGSLRADFGVGSVMLITDHVNMTGTCSLVGENPVDHHGQPLGPRFPDLSDVYDPKMRRNLHPHLKAQGLTVHEGIYLGLLGPAFETVAEVQLYRRWGMDAVGMSTVWEAIALKHSGARVVGLSLMSNLACGLDQTPPDHEDVLKNCAQGAAQILHALSSYFATEFKQA